VGQNMIVLDTNVLSELIKSDCNPSVLEWCKKQPEEKLYITAMTKAEMLYGIEILPSGKRKTELAKAAHDAFENMFEGRILDFDEQAAESYGTLRALNKKKGTPIYEADCIIAAITDIYHATLATRNIKDFKQCGIKLVNPWKG
jgi:toxin FitB